MKQPLIQYSADHSMIQQRQMLNLAEHVMLENAGRADGKSFRITIGDGGTKLWMDKFDSYMRFTRIGVVWYQNESHDWSLEYYVGPDGAFFSEDELREMEERGIILCHFCHSTLEVREGWVPDTGNYSERWLPDADPDMCEIAHPAADRTAYAHHECLRLHDPDKNWSLA